MFDTVTVLVALLLQSLWLKSRGISSLLLHMHTKLFCSFCKHTLIHLVSVPTPSSGSIFSILTSSLSLVAHPVEVYNSLNRYSIAAGALFALCI